MIGDRPAALDHALLDRQVLEMVSPVARRPAVAVQQRLDPPLERRRRARARDGDDVVPERLELLRVDRDRADPAGEVGLGNDERDAHYCRFPSPPARFNANAANAFHPAIRVGEARQARNPVRSAQPLRPARC